MCATFTKAVQGRPVVEVDVKGCRVNAIIEANVHDVPIFSPTDEFKPQIA